MANDHPVAERSWSAFGVIAGLSELALGRRFDAEKRLVGDARSAADGRNPCASNTSLVGLAALVCSDGDIEWAIQTILGAPLQRLRRCTQSLERWPTRSGLAKSSLTNRKPTS